MIEMIEMIDSMTDLIYVRFASNTLKYVLVLHHSNDSNILFKCLTENIFILKNSSPAARKIPKVMASS